MEAGSPINRTQIELAGRTDFMSLFNRMSQTALPQSMSRDDLDLPDDWTKAPTDADPSGDPPPSGADSHFTMFGQSEHDESCMLYQIPSPPDLRRIVHFFGVGGHGAITYGFDPERIKAAVAEAVIEIAGITAIRPVFADWESFRLRFDGAFSTEDAAEVCDVLFSDPDPCIIMGLEEYMDHGNPVEAIFRERQLRFWWD